MGAFGRWSTSDGISLNGVQGLDNGWLVLLYLPLAAWCALARSTVRHGVS